MHLVRPGRFLFDLAAILHIPAIAKFVGADPNVYISNRLLELPCQNNIWDDGRVHAFILEKLK
jgi:hypothetical protein